MSKVPRVPFWNNPQYLGGLVTFALGVFVLLESMNYPRGTLLRMGPGYFPTILGVVLLLLGGLLFASGRISVVRIASPEIRAPLFIGLGLICFAILMPRFGLAPAIGLLVPISALASPLSRLMPTFIMTLLMIGFTWVVFVKLLSLPFALLTW